MRIETTAAALADLKDPVLVPTMGAMHDGHISLIRLAAARGGPVIASVFVNPTQFAPNEDFEEYPRNLVEDAEAAVAAGAVAIYAPHDREIYPDGPDAALAAAERFDLPPVATLPRLEDNARPHFFGGVCLVVSRLFDLIKPRAAVFGAKDWQQLKTIEAMVNGHGRFRGIEIVAGPIVREPDGLARSSRNVYLDDSDRPAALALKGALEGVAATSMPLAAEEAMREVLTDKGLLVDYAVVRDAQTLLDPMPGKPTRALIAAHLTGKNGRIRLIDNAPAAVLAQE
jgi:pantoate--beta-alanine ligase